MNWYIHVFKHFADFTGRARRAEYWYFALFNILIAIALTIIDIMIVGVSGGFFPLSTIYSLVVLIPSLAVGARRLHDTGRSGWWLLIGIIPFIGAIVLLVFFVTEGNHGDNEYGPDPKAPAAMAV